MTRPQSRIRRFVFRLIGLSLGLLMAVGLGEGLFTIYAYWKYRTIDIETLMSFELGNNTFIEDQRTGYTATLYPHPYLGFVRKDHRKEDPSRSAQRVNNIGLTGRDFPIQKVPGQLTILLTGGSVACQLGQAGRGGQSYLERELNENYQFDRKVVVLNGGGGAWHQPQQTILYLLYGGAVDAVVMLDGFNEQFRLAGSDHRLEYPSNNFHAINPLATNGYETLGASWECQKLKQFSLDHRWRIVYFATRFLRQRIEKGVNESEENISVESIFALPESWSRSDRDAFNLNQYERYIRSIAALAALNQSKVVQFIQPCPAIGKQLTEEERRHAGDLSYADRYREMEASVLRMDGKGLRVFSLRDVFAGTSERIYSDTIHCIKENQRDRTYDVNFVASKGYEMISKAMAARIAEAWGIPKRASQPARSG